jgi:hypothetical protein
VFHWIYALVHSPRYRQRFRAMLSIDFPRIPWPTDLRTFRELARAGKELAEIHCSVAADTPRHDEPEPVEQAVWQFRLGGYPVLRRWLQQRAHRSLSVEDQQHLLRMVHAIHATLRQMEVIDRLPDSLEDVNAP